METKKNNKKQLDSQPTQTHAVHMIHYILPQINALNCQQKYMCTHKPSSWHG